MATQVASRAPKLNKIVTYWPEKDRPVRAKIVAITGNTVSLAYGGRTVTGVLRGFSRRGLQGRWAYARPTLGDGLTFANVSYPIIVAHRGGDDVRNEASIEAYDKTIKDGGICLEGDAYPLADNYLACSHDDTVDRATSGSGLVSSFTKAQFEALQADALGYGPVGTPTTWDDVFARYGKNTLYFPEVKSSASQLSLPTLIQTMGLKQQNLVNAFVLANLTNARDMGIDVCLLISGPTSLNVASTVAAGVEWVAFDYTANPSAKIAESIAAGLKVAVYTVDRLVDRDTFTALGVHGIITDEPIYFLTSTAYAPHALKTGPGPGPYPFEGMLANTAGSNYRGEWVNGEWGLGPNTPLITNAGFVVGTAYMSDNIANPASFRRTCKVVFTNITTGSIWIALSTTDDPFTGTGSTTVNQTTGYAIDGYHLRLRPNVGGTNVTEFRLYRKSKAAFDLQLGGTVAQPTPAPGAAVYVEFVRTATSLTVNFTGAVVGQITSSVPDATLYTPRNWQFGRTGTNTQLGTFSYDTV